jgi:MraZ protein
VSDFFFSGSVAAKLDEKKRFVLPHEMRYGLVENGELTFSIGLGLGGCLAIYRQSDIRQIATKFKRKQYVGEYQQFFTLFFSTLHQTSCDKTGRVVLPTELKKAVEIKQEIMIAGVLDKIEIWPREKYEMQLSGLLSGKNPECSLGQMVEKAFALLEEENDPRSFDIE